MLMLAWAGIAGCALPGRLTAPGDWRAAMQPPLTADVAARLAEGPALDFAIALAVERSPSVAAERARWRAAIERIPQETSLEDPMLGFGYQTRDVPKEMNMEKWRLTLEQPIPWWRKLWARGRAAELEAAVARLRYEAAIRDLVIDVKDSYYELYYLDQALPITERIEALLRNEGVLAYSQLGVGRTSLTEAFRAESQAAQLGYDRILLAEQRAAQAERLRALANLPPGTQIGRVARAPLYPLAPSVEPLFARAEQYAQSLRTRGLEIQRAEYDTYLARLRRIPDATVGVEILKMPDITPVMAMASMNLPIWEQRNRALIRQKQVEEEAMRAMAIQDLNDVRQGVAEAYFQARLTQRLTDLYANVLLPQAESIMRQADVFFRYQDASFSNVIETTLAYHNFVLAYHRATADYGQALGRLERAIGATARAQAPASEPPVAGGAR
jgi:outer membrane protein TolC